MKPRPLDGYIIVEAGTAEAEGLATLLLSDYGAQVYRLELEQAPSGEMFRVCDRGKTKVSCRLECEEDRAWLGELLAKADGFVTSLPEEQLVGWELDADTLRRRNPRLVHVSVTGYGQRGPWAGRPFDEGCVQAESGLMSITGPEGGEPVRTGGEVAVFAGGASACVALLMGLIDVRRTGKGRAMDVSMMDAILYGLENQFSVYLRNGQAPRPMGNHYALAAPVGDYRCGDGQSIMISLSTQAQWEKFVAALGNPAQLCVPDYSTFYGRLAHHRQLDREINAVFEAYSSDELLELMLKAGCVCGKINDLAAAAAHPQVAARGMLLEAVKEDGTSVRVPSDPLTIDGCRCAEGVYRDTVVCHKCGV